MDEFNQKEAVAAFLTRRTPRAKSASRFEIQSRLAEVIHCNGEKVAEGLKPSGDQMEALSAALSGFCDSGQLYFENKVKNPFDNFPNT